MDAAAIITRLLGVLPDADRDDWEWAWGEMGDEAQEEVKAAREVAELYLATHTKAVPPPPTEAQQ